MSQHVTHVYLMPGMCASPIIFEYIKLPQAYQVHWLEWFTPNTNESLSSYAKRMTEKIKHKHCVLIGVSFGGILVQEMSKFITPKKLIIISSVKSNKELPNKMKLAKRTKAYKLLPTGFVSKSNIELLAKYALGVKVPKRLELYKKYLSVSDKKYLDWAIDNMLNWHQDRVIPDIIHIQGDKDPVFPIKNIENCIIVKGGTHVMIINKFKWFNENLPILLES